MELILFDNAKRAVAQLQEFDEVKEHLDKSAACQEYARRANDRDMEIRAAKYRVYCERRAGEMLLDAPGHRKARNDASLTSADAGIERTAATRFRQLADVPEEDFDTAMVELEAEDTPPTRGRIMEKAKPHVAQNSGNNEWYTPAEYIEAARAVMGEIDLDPASSATANAKIKAKRFYSEREDGLSARRIWKGRVWMNPPYSGDRVGAFCTKLAKHVEAGDVPAAVVLVNNATETQWFSDLVGIASSVCFPSRRVKFWRPDGKFGAPLQGQAIIYIGKSRQAFAKRFKGLGWIANVV